MIEGFNHCKKWEGVHDGSIKDLIYEHDSNHFDDLLYARRQYLERLKSHSSSKNKKPFKSRRIIILNKENREDLRNREIMQKFWNITGKYVKSYWIEKESIEKELNGRDLDDAALLDGQIFLQYDRNERIIRFNSDEKYDEKLKLVKRLFDLLDNHSNVYVFVEITKEMCMPLSGSQNEITNNQ